MIPSVLSKQIEQGIKDFLSTTFHITTPFFHGMLEQFLEMPGTVFMMGLSFRLLPDIQYFRTFYLIVIIKPQKEKMKKVPTIKKPHGNALVSMGSIYINAHLTRRGLEWRPQANSAFIPPAT